jgi:murein DD-endopeptidase MepM/ murein hydrolase activator NlpD
LGLVVVAIVYFGFINKENFFDREGSGEPIVVAQENNEPDSIAIEDDDSGNIVTHIVAEGDIPAEVFSEHGGYDANDTAALLLASEEVFDFTHVKIGQPLRFYFEDGQDRASRMEYDRNTEQMIIVERSGDEFNTREEDIVYDIAEETARGTIENFFYVDALDAGLSEATVLDVGDIFSFSIDFTTEIRQGDEFVFVYQKRKRDGKDAPDGYILASKFVNDGTAYYAYYYDNDGEGGYYDGDGHALERQFLKAPLSYRQITSGFTGARMHPITKTVTAHYQIDYAAPTGTPVVASARGTVVSAGWEGGWGYMIRMRHDNGYTTHYGHLSAFAKGITAGTQVAQGQVIGYVGSTGWSTGPHLDYGMKLNGSPINPLTLVQPKGAPLAEDKMNDFIAMKERYAAILQ